MRRGRPLWMMNQASGLLTLLPRSPGLPQKSTRWTGRKPPVAPVWPDFLNLAIYNDVNVLAQNINFKILSNTKTISNECKNCWQSFAKFGKIWSHWPPPRSRSPSTTSPPRWSSCFKGCFSGLKSLIYKNWLIVIHAIYTYLPNIVTRLGDFLLFGQLFTACGNDFSPNCSHFWTILDKVSCLVVKIFLGNFLKILGNFLLNYCTSHFISMVF